MEYLIKETIKEPRLVDLTNVSIPVKKDNFKFYLNTLVFILFVGFIIFFLYNCKHGIFCVKDNVLPYNFDKIVFFN